MWKFLILILLQIALGVTIYPLGYHCHQTSKGQVCVNRMSGPHYERGHSGYVGSELIHYRECSTCGEWHNEVICDCRWFYRYSEAVGDKGPDGLPGATGPTGPSGNNK